MTLPGAGSASPLLELLRAHERLTNRPYGAQSDESIVVGDVLMQHVPALASGELELVAIVRRPGVLSKAAVRRRLQLVHPSVRPVPLVLGVGAEHLRAVRNTLGGERVHVVQWHADPVDYIANALGLSYIPSTVVQPFSRRVEVLVGELDYPAACGPHAVNRRLASALTGWRIGVTAIGRSRNWRALEAARTDVRPILAQVVGKAPKGLRVRVYGLNALLPIGQISGIKRSTPAEVVEAELQRRLQQELQGNVLRLDADRGLIFVSERVPAGRQLRLPL